MKSIRIMLKQITTSKKGIILYTTLMGLFYMWFVSIFDPIFFEDFEALLESYPEAIRQMIGEFYSLSTIGGLMNIYLFSMSLFFFGVYFTLKASQDIPREIDNKTIDIMLSKPIKRWEFSLGKYLYHIVSAVIILLGVMLAVILGILIMPTVAPNEVPWAEFLTAFLVMILLNLCIISTGFFFSTFLDTKKSLVLSFGVIIFFYAVGQFWQSFGENMEGIKYISIFYYSDMSNLLVNSNWELVPLKISFLSIYSIGLTVASVIIFNKRDIPV
ncbi:MAG: ABC transporter permease subunit [Promethearchaeota archaeon]|nr:MAG: ABC transporter permease subunit [Candidatus Lokiarchaeota archaeon]